MDGKLKKNDLCVFRMSLYLVTANSYLPLEQMSAERMNV